jgi:hypothetical protein
MNVFKLIEDNGLKLDGDIEHFAELVAQQEREACAKVCDARADEDGFEGGYADQCAIEIRARGKNGG